jgi:hypothetical protein
MTVRNRFSLSSFVLVLIVVIIYVLLCLLLLLLLLLYLKVVSYIIYAKDGQKKIYLT